MSKLITDKLQSPPSLGVGGNAVPSHASSQQPSILQQKHLQHIVGSGRNSVVGIEEVGHARGANPFTGSILQGPLA